jgi:nucleoside-diphosphate-sugar epimerase
MENLEGVDETHPYPAQFFSHYSHSKALAEQYTLAVNGQNNVAICALRPHLIWGPRDNHIIPMSPTKKD